jgi:hypothetical protein
MSVFSNVESVPSRVRGVFRYLLMQNGQCASLEAITAALAPDALSDGDQPRRKDAVTGTVDACVEMGLFTINDDVVAIQRELGGPQRDPLIGDDLLPSTLAKLVFSPDDATNPNVDFGRALAWVLTLDPYGPPLTWRLAEQRLKGSDAATLGFRDARFGNLCHWSVFLGYARSGGKGLMLIPDPTSAVRRSLSRLLAPGEKASIVDVLDQLAKSDPVLDSGTYRAEIDRWAAPDASRTQISRSLSLALKRLQDEEFIILKYGADTRSRTLQLKDSTEPYTTIQRSDGGVG